MTKSRQSSVICWLSAKLLAKSGKKMNVSTDYADCADFFLCLPLKIFEVRGSGFEVRGFDNGACNPGFAGANGTMNKSQAKTCPLFTG